MSFTLILDCGLRRAPIGKLRACLRHELRPNVVYRRQPSRLKLLEVDAQLFGRLHLNPKSKIQNMNDSEDPYGFQNAADNIWFNFFG